MARRSGSHAETTGPLVRQAAERLFARHGFAAVSMRQIAAEVGLSVGALYLYTPDKQTLLFDLMDSHMDQLHAAWRALSQPDEPIDRLHSFTNFHIRYHLTRPDAVFVAYMELRNLSPENFTKIEAKRRAYEAELEWILDFGRNEAAFQFDDTRITSMALISMLTGVTTWYRPDGRLPPRRIVRLYWRLVQKMVQARRLSEGSAKD